MAERFVVVAGSPRSGTSLLRTFLTRSDRLCVHKTEPHYVLELYRRHGERLETGQALAFLLGHEKFPTEEIGEAALRQALAGRTTIGLSELLAICYRLLNRERPDRVIVLKHPSFILHLDLVRRLLPGVAIIQAVRDPRANVQSQRTRWPSTSLWEAATRWRASVRAGRDWQRRGLGPYLEVRYEDLVTAPAETCSSVCEFLGVPFSSSMLAFDHVEREWNPANPGEGARRHYQGFERQRIDRWKQYLSPHELKLIEDRCRDGMALLGYEPLHPAVEMREYVPFYLQARRTAIRKSIRRMRRRVRAAAGGR